MCWAYRMKRSPACQEVFPLSEKVRPAFSNLLRKYACHTRLTSILRCVSPVFSDAFPPYLAMRPSRYVGDNSRSIGLPLFRHLRQAGNPPPCFRENDLGNRGFLCIYAMFRSSKSSISSSSRLTLSSSSISRSMRSSSSLRRCSSSSIRASFARFASMISG